MPSAGAAEVAQDLRAATDDFKAVVPVISTLATPALRERHWSKISEVLQLEMGPDDDLTLQKLLDLNIREHWEKVDTICVVAEKEYALEKSLDTMVTEWGDVVFELAPYKEPGTFVVREADHIIALQTPVKLTPNDQSS